MNRRAGYVVPGPLARTGVAGRSDALPAPSAGISSGFLLGRIIGDMEGPYQLLDDEVMLQAADEVEEAAAAAAGGAAGGGVAEEVPPAPAAPAPQAGGAGLLLRAGRHRATVVPELASRPFLCRLHPTTHHTTGAAHPGGRPEALARQLESRVAQALLGPAPAASRSKGAHIPPSRPHTPHATRPPALPPSPSPSSSRHRAPRIQNYG